MPEISKAPSEAVGSVALVWAARECSELERETQRCTARRHNLWARSIDMSTAGRDAIGTPHHRALR